KWQVGGSDSPQLLFSSLRDFLLSCFRDSYCFAAWGSPAAHESPSSASTGIIHDRWRNFSQRDDPLALGFLFLRLRFVQLLAPLVGFLLFLRRLIKLTQPLQGSGKPNLA